MTSLVNYSINVNHSTYSDYAENWVTGIGTLDSVNTDQFELQGSNLKIDEGYLAGFVEIMTNLSEYWRKDGVGDAEDMWDLGVYGIISQASYFSSIVIGTLVSPLSYIGYDDGEEVFTEINVLGRSKKEVLKAIDNKDWFLQYEAPSGDGWAGSEFKIEDIYNPTEYELKTLTKVWELD